MTAHRSRVLAGIRTQPLLAALAEARDPGEQARMLAAAPALFVPGIGWIGGVHSIADLLEDPAFELPWRTREETEEMVAAALRTRGAARGPS